MPDEVHTAYAVVGGRCLAFEAPTPEEAQALAQAAAASSESYRRASLRAALWRERKQRGLR